MGLTNLTIKDLITPDTKLTFLAGAGCSIDPPSCLPAGGQMIEAMVSFSCKESEVKRILSLKSLRFEQLVEILRDQLDPELKLIEYYGLCDNPNKIHLFLAEMMKRGHYVMTTNFDYLIEYALMQSAVKKESIVPVITKDDFNTYSNPEELYHNNQFPLYKVHGSCKNIITGEETKKSLIATIQAFGSGKEGESVFQLEPFKRSLFENISKNRTLVVMGYSGSDDFDIVPTLKQLRELNQIIWIDHAGQGTIPEVIAINTGSIVSDDNKVGTILQEIQQMDYGVQVYRIKVNTIEFIETICNLTLEVKGESFTEDPNEYLRYNLRTPNAIELYETPFKIYRKLSELRFALQCAGIALARTKMDENFKKPTFLPEKALLLKQVELLIEIATIHLEIGELEYAKNKFGDALEICEKELENIDLTSKIYTNMGFYLLNKGDTTKAFDFLNKSLKIDEDEGNLGDKAKTLLNIGRIMRIRGQSEQAFNYFKEVLKIAEQLGDLIMRARALSEIGISQNHLGDNDGAINNLNEALKIGEQLGDLKIKAEALNNMGQINEKRKSLEEVMVTYKQVLSISEQLRDIRMKADTLIKIGHITELISGEREGLRYYKEALKIAKDLSDKEIETQCYISIGQYHETRKNDLEEALSYYKTADYYADDLGDLRLKAEILRKKGFVLYLKGEINEALKNYQQSLTIAEQIGNKVLEYEALGKIGLFWYDKEDLDKSQQFYTKAYSICNQMGNFSDELILLEKIGKSYYDQKNLDKSQQIYKDALSIAEQLGYLSKQAELLDLIGGIYFLKSNLSEGLKYAESCLQILESTKSPKKDYYTRVVEELKHRLNSTQ